MAPFKVAVYLYPNADILDFSGPVEIYSTTALSGPPAFSITTFAHHNPVHTPSGAMTYTPSASFQEVAEKIEEYDVLVIPGANFNFISDFIKSSEGKELNEVLRKFVSTKPREETGQRVLQSVCTGSVLLAASGILAGRNVTTHHLGFDMIKQVGDYGAEDTMGGCWDDGCGGEDYQCRGRDEWD
jgi:putative intracellular protease/amidase